MENMTIGKFISALRRAKGLTQKELGDMLYVSDKTVSRWERDECLPDLRLIPAIAEIFGITSDELLRGERASEGSNPEGVAMGERRLAAVCKGRLTRFSNLSFIAFILAFTAIIVAVVCVFCGSEDGLAWLGFLLPAFLAVIAVICEVMFALNGIIMPNEELAAHGGVICAHNARVASIAVSAVMANAFVFGLCMPLVVADMSPVFAANPVVLFVPGVGIGYMLALAAYGIYFRFVRNKMVEEGMLQFSAEQSAAVAADNRALLIISLVCGIICILAMIFSIFALANPGIFHIVDETATAYYSYTAMLASYMVVPASCIVGAVSYLCVRARRKKNQK